MISKYLRCLFFVNINVFRHLKLEIVLAIPVSNEWKIKAYNSAAGFNAGPLSTTLT